jgi:Fic family protein
MYIHELQDWPRFHWSQGELAEPLASVRHRQGRLIGHMEALGFSLRQEAVLQTLTGDVVKSSEIEGEALDAEQVRSSIARRLGLDIGALKPADRHIEGIVDLALARSESSPQPFYSMSTQIRQERRAYYDILERTQKGTLDITPWMSWFLGCLGRAIDAAQGGRSTSYSLAPESVTLIRSAGSP